MSIGFIGSGNMAKAIVKGVLNQDLYDASDVRCVSGSGTTSRALAQQTGITPSENRLDLIEQSRTIIVAFKPQHLESISESESKAATDKLIISVLAGRKLESLKTIFPTARNIVRVMPNTPSQIGKGVSAYCFDQPPTDKDLNEVVSILSALGSSHAVNESQMHIVTAVSGCGPAVFFRFVDLIAQAASKRGLDYALATQLAIETGLGSLELMRQSDKRPRNLVDEVVSPNGVTHALLTSLDRDECPEIIERSIQAAVDRSEELS